MFGFNWREVYDKVKVVFWVLAAAVITALIDQFTAFDWSFLGGWAVVLPPLVAAILAWVKKEVVGHTATGGHTPEVLGPADVPPIGG